MQSNKIYKILLVSKYFASVSGYIFLLISAPDKENINTKINP